MQNSELSASLKELKKKKKESTSTASGRGKRSKLSEQESRISHFAKLFGVMHEPLVPPSALQATRPDMSSLLTAMKVIPATNHIDILDPAPLRSGHLDQNFESSLPNDTA
jgi:SpoVK/Ycf46/Vps4 family AAA+-type ATPase